MISFQAKSSQIIKSSYEEMIKLLLRIYPLSDLEIIVGDYLIEKAKLDDMSKEEEHMSSEFNVDQQQLKQALRKLEKYRIVESFDKKIRKIQNENERTKKKLCTLWKINEQICKDTEFIEKDLSLNYQKNKKKNFFVCTKCEQKYSLDEAFMLNNRCRLIECQERLDHKQLNQQELNELSVEEQQSKDIFTKIRNIIVKIGQSQWPFKENLEQYSQQQELQKNQNIQTTQIQNQTNQKQKEQEINLKLRYMKQIFQYDVILKIQIDLNLDNMLKLNLSDQTFKHLKSKITNS